MSEIEKMYENAGIERTPAEAHCLRCWYGTCVLSEKECKKKNKQKCKDFKGSIIDGKYPPFTAEKQIELIKLLAKGEVKINNEDGEYEFSVIDTVSDFSSFEESLADLVNRMWLDLTEEEKQQVKGILE